MEPGDHVPSLFRGESLSHDRSDKERVATIKQFHLTGQGLWTKLVNHGNPYELIQLGLLEGLKRHIADATSFATTHFLSFTSHEAAALFYARTPPVTNEEDIGQAPYPDEGWRYTKYVVFKLKVAEPQPISEGVYCLRYNSGANAAILINALEYLSALPGDAKTSPLFTKAFNFANDDKEWLVLPADPIKDGTLSACLCKGSDFEVSHYVESAFFTDR
jgi:hypothetical protein